MIRRLYVEKKKGCDVSAEKIRANIGNILNIFPSKVREFIRYDIEGLLDKDYLLAKDTIFSELPIDMVYEEELPELQGYGLFVIEFLPGQYDQRADSAEQCVQLTTMGERPVIRCAKVIAVKDVTPQELNAIKNYMINPVESREGSLLKPETLEQKVDVPESVDIICGFINMNDGEIKAYHKSHGFAMSAADLCFVRDYFQSEKRNPTVTEIKVIDTYWSDHCRHTTFLTEITDIEVNSDNPHVQAALQMYQGLFDEINGGRADKYRCLMDIATIAGKKLIRSGVMKNIDLSDEINACSIKVKADVNGKREDWLVMFKNETHNHPTEIEPYGGAATCLGGAIRDPLSGRTYVYQAMRVTGAGDPTADFKDTMSGKLPQRVLTTTATAGFSSYGNQIGLATGIVDEIYHPGYKAKRLETGFVIGAAPKSNVRRQIPKKGDIVVLLGGDTGRDGCGGATGSSKAHTVESVDLCGAEVQKGNPLIERKIQRLFRNPEAAKLIIKCNDFGAGGVSVAIGELSDGIDIDLDAVPKKYSGLDGTELAISESQERMAVMLEKKDLNRFIRLAAEENLNCTPCAKVTDLNRVRMNWNGKQIVDISRDFLNTNGVKQAIKAAIHDNKTDYLFKAEKETETLLKSGNIADAIKHELTRLNVCSKKGMSETFDSTIGAASVTMPWGGKHQMTPTQVMAAKLPVGCETTTATVCSYACYPYLNASSPFTGAVYSLVTSVAKLAAAGVDRKTVRLTLQEFFMRLKEDPKRWGVPLSALLGALYAQMNMGIGAIGGKDSMSGSFEDLDVPPTLISFAVGISKTAKLRANVWKGKGNLYLLKLKRDNAGIPDFDYALKLWDYLYSAGKKLKAAQVVEEGGAVVAAIKSALGNGVGIDFISADKAHFAPSFGDVIVQASSISEDIDYELIGSLNGSGIVNIGGAGITSLELNEWFNLKLMPVFPIKAESEGKAKEKIYNIGTTVKSRVKCAKPKVFIPVFPGTNCEYDTARAFERSGASPDTLIIRNRSAKDIEESVSEIVKRIEKSQIIAFPGGFSGGDEPDGSGKFIATTFRNPAIAEAVMNLLYKRDGLIIGICNGFQALIKLGLVPYGEITAQVNDSPTLTYNRISRHVSTISRVKVVSNKSPWLNKVKTGAVYSVPISHGEGRFIATPEEILKLSSNGQIATQYVDLKNKVTMQSPYNPNGSMNAVEGILSPDGRVLGKMGHAERLANGLYINYHDEFDMQLFESGTEYYK
jgi:phosphoribosylformylglycinamidine synthase